MLSTSDLVKYETSLVKYETFYVKYVTLSAPERRCVTQTHGSNRRRAAAVTEAVTLSVATKDRQTAPLRGAQGHVLHIKGVVLHEGGVVLHEVACG